MIIIKEMVIPFLFVVYLLLFLYNIYGDRMNKIHKIIYSVLLILLVIFAIYIVKDSISEKTYLKEYNYFNEIIIISLDTNKEVNSIFKYIDLLYKKYDQLLDKKQEYKNIKNLYYLKNNNSNKKYIKINKQLLDIIKYSKEKKYNQDVVIKGDSILNNHADIDLNGIKEEYINQIIKKYLIKQKITKYTINMNNIITIGSNLEKIGLPDPDNELNILDFIKTKNSCVASIKSNNKVFKSITVVSLDSCQSIAIELIHKQLEDGQKLVENNDNVEALWYMNNNKFVESSNFKKFR